MVTDSIWNHTHLFLLVCILQLSFLKTHWARKSNLVIWTVRLLTGISRAVVSWGLMFAPLHCSTASTSHVKGCILFWEQKPFWHPPPEFLSVAHVLCTQDVFLAGFFPFGWHWRCLFAFLTVLEQMGCWGFAFNFFLYFDGNKDLNRFRQLLRIPGYRME